MPSTNTPPTIYDVAEKAGVSIATVSRMLNSPDKVSPDTRDRIMAAIDQLGFVPKAEARARALRRTARIGVITPFFTAPSFVQRMRGIATALGKANYELVVYPVESPGQLESYFGSIPLTGNLDGLIVVSLPVSDTIARRLNSFNIPTVLIEYSHPTLNCVEIDDFEGGRMAAEYLIRKGHKRIAFMANPDIPEYAVATLTRRFTGFSQTLADAGIELPENYVRQASENQEQIYQATADLLHLPCPPTAIFAALDTYATGVLKAVRQLDVHVPDQLAIIGFDDLDIAEYADLTTIRQHLDESGRLAVEILLAHIADPSRPVQHAKLPLILIERLTA
jgi:DNA-binding LacI/PurR family transcriptional regulator